MPFMTLVGKADALVKVGRVTGHKTRSVFERYNIVNAGDLREAAKRLDAVTGTISGTIEQNRRSGSKPEIDKSLCDNS